MSKKAEDVVEEAFEGVAASDEARELRDPLLALWNENRWTAEEIARAAEEIYKPT